jgi:hypothetical protein
VPIPGHVAVGGRSCARHRQQPYVVPPTPFAPYGTPVVSATVDRPEPRKRPGRSTGAGRQARARRLATEVTPPSSLNLLTEEAVARLSSIAGHPEASPIVG